MQESIAYIHRAFGSAGEYYMWNIFVCDDEQSFRDQITALLDRYSKDSGEEFSVSYAASGEELLKKLDDKADLLLLDIQMKTLTGMNAARVLRQRGNEIPIIFITSMTEYAIEGYEVHAFGFLKKPVHYRQLAWLLDELLSKLKRERGVSIVVQDRNTLMNFKSSEISWIEALGHDIILHLTDGTEQRCNTPLAELEKQLEGNGFYRVHKSFLVNMLQVRSVGLASVTLVDGTDVPLSKHRKQDFLFAFASSKGLS